MKYWLIVLLTHTGASKCLCELTFEALSQRTDTWMPGVCCDLASLLELFTILILPTSPDARSMFKDKNLSTCVRPGQNRQTEDHVQVQ